MVDGGWCPSTEILSFFVTISRKRAAYLAAYFPVAIPWTAFVTIVTDCQRRLA